MPPDWVFLTAWPLLKLGALRADVRAVRLSGGRLRRTVLALRVVDWLLFALFGRLAPASGRVAVVVSLTVGQAVATAEAVRRARRVDPVLARSLVPQLLWLLYAAAVPVLMTVEERGASRR